MPNRLLPRSVVSLACIVALTAVSVASAASHRTNTRLLASELPPGVTLATASTQQIAAAVGAAITKRPNAAPDLTGIALRAGKSGQDAPDCGSVREIVNAAMHAAPDRARAISELAESLAPDCTQEIARVLKSAGGGDDERRSPADAGAAVPGSRPEADATGEAAGGGFGGGFGPGFPASPIFGGRSPSGGVALPPASQPPVTSVTNG